MILIMLFVAMGNYQTTKDISPQQFIIRGIYFLSILAKPDWGLALKKPGIAD